MPFFSPRLSNSRGGLWLRRKKAVRSQGRSAVRVPSLSMELKQRRLLERAVPSSMHAGAFSYARGGIHLRYLLIATCMTLTLATPAQANQQEMRERQCRYQWVDKGTWTAREERRTALCVVGRWPVPGGWTEFRHVIECESGWSRIAFNPAGPYVGLGQHALGSWPTRVRAYSPPLWNLPTPWQNSRTMLTITARMMNAEGLSAWGCA